MRKTTFILVPALLAGLLIAQEQSESVDSIMKELENYQSAEKATPVATTSTAVEVAPVATQTEAPVTEAPAPVAEVVSEETTPVAEVEEVPEETASNEEVDALLEESRELYAGGEFEQAQAGFEAIIKKVPENMIARMYLRKIYERDFRTAEISGMDAVTAAWDTSLVLRSYEISPDAAEKMELNEVDEATDVTIKFPEVEFLKGTSAVYQPRMEKLFVRNTRENLLIVEEILEAMDVAKLSSDVEQVEVETKFVEVSEGTLEELGFEWQSYGSYDDNGGLIPELHTGLEGKDIIVNSKDFLFDDALRGGASYPIDPTSGSSMPFSRPDTLGAGSDAGYGNWSAFRFEDSFNKTPGQLKLEHRGSTTLDIIITALDQSTGKDVLSAPRVVTKSGEEAIIRVGELHTFPEVYEPSASGGNIVHVSYEDWEERLLGIELAVTPQVDGDQI
ncbi:MAG: hypothetical protein KAG97_12870, partial [Victivallales bacterium]|nr:hypothetical protein [Victivallales bacterium]